MVAGLIIFMRLVDLFWVIRPDAYRDGRFTIGISDIAAPIGIGGIWLFFYFWQLKSKPLMPLHDPYIEEAFEHAGH